MSYAHLTDFRASGTLVESLHQIIRWFGVALCRKISLLIFQASGGASRASDIPASHPEISTRIPHPRHTLSLESKCAARHFRQRGIIILHNISPNLKNRSPGELSSPKQNAHSSRSRHSLDVGNRQYGYLAEEFQRIQCFESKEKAEETDSEG